MFTKEVMLHPSGLIAQCNSLTLTKTHVSTIVRHGRRTDMQNSKHFQAFSIITDYWELEF